MLLKIFPEAGRAEDEAVDGRLAVNGLRADEGLGRLTWAVDGHVGIDGSMSHASFAPLSIQVCILASTMLRRSLGERTSRMKSGQLVSGW
jgi:hypothetical protein